MPQFLTYCARMFHGGALGTMKAVPVGTLVSLMLWQLAFACVKVCSRSEREVAAGLLP